MKTLWLTSWYPNKLSPFNGDFIRRHAAAVSLYEQVQVIYITRDEKGEMTKDVLKEEAVDGQLTETIVYYHSPKRFFSFLDKFSSERKYRQLFKQAVEDYLNKNGKPDIVHVQVGMKAGSVAIWLKRNFNIPYVLTEHWSGFLAEAREKFSQLPFYFRSIWKEVLNSASGCSTVSKHLVDAIKRIFPGTSPVIIPNVVDTRIFFPAPASANHPRFIHISGLDELKNPKEILLAFRLLCQSYPEAVLEIFGSTKEEIVEFADELGLKNNVFFREEVPQSVLAVYINSSNALVLYSSYETFGCVVIEANACGVPVIVSDIPVFHETVKEGVNGVFAAAHNPESLALKMLEIIRSRSSFDSKAIATMTGSKYSYEVVGKQFSDWYREVLGKT